jgi:hypothetical protein
MRRYSVIRHNKKFTIDMYPSGNADVYWRVVNPKTGKGWQAHCDLQHFDGPRAQGRAMVAWMRAARLVRAVQV